MDHCLVVRVCEKAYEQAKAMQKNLRTDMKKIKNLLIW